MNGVSPCSVCGKSSCWECVLNGMTKENECTNYNCFLNYEGDCLISVFEKCGAWKKDG